jgi:hypothetical protein
MKLWTVIKRWYDDVLVVLFTGLGVFANGILPDLMRVQRGEAETLTVAPARIVTAGVLAGVLILLESARGGGGEDAKAGKQKPVNLGFRIALGFFAGYTLTGLTGGV